MTFRQKQIQLAWDFGEDLAFRIERCLVSDTDESPTLTELFEAATGGLNDAGAFYSDTEHQDHHPRNCHPECEVWRKSREVDLRAKKPLTVADKKMASLAADISIPLKTAICPGCKFPVSLCTCAVHAL